MASLFAIAVYAKPKITVENGFDINNHAQIKVTNGTIEELACYVAIDGQKIRFRLLAYRSSRWFKATDPRYNHSTFSSWCDYIELYPNFKKFRAY